MLEKIIGSFIFFCVAVGATFLTAYVGLATPPALVVDKEVLSPSTIVVISIAAVIGILCARAYVLYIQRLP
jgi:formate-dependent nitrite reductase membrane component NrfD